ncbi:MAG: DUF615 domain-containing protein [Chromatiaceae bacterium]|nr:MAG: DUF615 domain-containing protein [Chromatiaceae bacterium]
MSATDHRPASNAADPAVGPDPDLADSPSKSAVKRDLLALQDLAAQIAQLPAAELAALDLSAATRAALAETARIRDRRALRRHYKRIANCLAREHTAPLHTLLAARAAQAQADSARHHQVEDWRARLIASGDQALGEFLAHCPGADRQQLRQLIRAAQRDQARGRPEAPRRLFRQLRAWLAEASAPGDEPPA